MVPTSRLEVFVDATSHLGEHGAGLAVGVAQMPAIAHPFLAQMPEGVLAPGKEARGCSRAVLRKELERYAIDEGYVKTGNNE